MSSPLKSVVYEATRAVAIGGMVSVMLLFVLSGAHQLAAGALSGLGFFSALWKIVQSMRGVIFAIGLCCAIAFIAVWRAVKQFQDSLTKIQDTLQRLPLDRGSPVANEGEIRSPYMEAQTLAKVVGDIQRAFSDRETLFERSQLRLRDQINQRTQEAEEAGRRAYALAMVDSLTKLPNRMKLNLALEEALADALSHRAFACVLFIDVDHFKRLNDSLGHELGDKVLQHVAQTLRQNLRDGDTAARLGGDEFVVVLRNLPPDNAKVLVDRYLGNVYAALRNPIELTSRNTLITLSIGAAVYPADGTDSATLMRNADTAMYSAKQKGRNRADWYRAGNNHGSPADLSKREQALRQAIASKQLIVMFQPQSRTDDGMPVGVETLVRWRHPERGIILPSGFIELAEQSGLIVPLGQQVLEMALAHAKRWNARDLNMRIAVNLSVRQLEQQGWSDSLRQLVESFDLPLSIIDLEITETVIADDPNAMEQMLKKLSKLGFTLSLDDFGTGYSSLNYLARFPFDNVKIDRQFVQDIDSLGSRNVVQSIITLGHALNMRIIAEGVETPQQFRVLRDMGCDEVQGFFVAEPMHADEIPLWWEQRVKTTQCLSEHAVVQSARNVLPMSSGRSMSATLP